MVQSTINGNLGSFTMTREEINEAYGINERGMITALGKFEAEMCYAPYIYEYASYGEELSFSEDGCGEYVSLVSVDASARLEFPELGSAAYVLVTESDNGFVSCQLVADEDAANKIRAAYEEE